MTNQIRKSIIGAIRTGNNRVPGEIQEQATELIEADGTAIVDAIERSRYNWWK